jgi:aminopeptidase
MNLADFERFVERALFLDQPDPERSWGELRAFQAQLIERLRGARELRLESAGTDVTLTVKGRTWVNSDGKRNMPSGEVFTGPHEASASGIVILDVPWSPAGGCRPTARSSSRTGASRCSDRPPADVTKHLHTSQ